jgi:hypothetical protein
MKALVGCSVRASEYAPAGRPPSSAALAAFVAFVAVVAFVAFVAVVADVAVSACVADGTVGKPEKLIFGGVTARFAIFRLVTARFLSCLLPTELAGTLSAA